MQLLSLELRAFGPFTDVTLDFSDRQPGLHVVYGHNEAGKSTTLRALTQLLFGIPHRTADDHLHRMSDLRVGARLVTAAGDVLHVVRRKARKNDLLDSGDAPLDESLLRSALHGVDVRQFQTTFGLDHASLREGGRALVEGHGAVGESLFDAATGARGIHELLQALEQEAAALFTPRGKNPKLNAALSAYKRAAKEQKDNALAPSAWTEQLDGIRVARAQFEETDARHRELSGRKEAIARDLQVLPLLAERRTRKRERDALGEVPPLPEGATDERRRAEKELERQAVRREQHEAELQRVESELVGLDVPKALAEIPDDRIEELRELIGIQRQAARDRPTLEAQRDAALTEARRVAAGLPFEVDVDDASRLRVPAARRNAIRRMSEERVALDAKRSAARRRVAESEKRLAALREDSECVQLTDLRRALAAVSRLDVHPEADLAELDAVAREAERVAAEQLGKLAPWSGDVKQFASLTVPSAETVSRFTEELATLERDDVSLAAQRSESSARRASADEGLERLQLTGEVPTEEMLANARGRRDERWAAVSAVLDGEDADDAAERGAAYLDGVRKADEVSDRLRREADRVQQAATFEAQRRASERRLKELGEREGERRGRYEAWEKRWADAWSAAGIVPLMPVEMRGWLERFREARSAADDARAARTRHARLEERVQVCRRALAAALGAGADEALAALADRASEVVARLEEAEREAEELARSRLDASESDEQAGAWRERWRRELAEIGLAAETESADAQAVLDELEALVSRRDHAAGFERRLADIDASTQRFEEEIDALVSRCAPDLGAEPVLDRGRQLVSRHQRARRDQESLRKGKKRAEELRAILNNGEAKEKEARMALDRLARQAGVTVEVLPEVEQRAVRAQQLDSEIERLDARLLESGGGLDVEELERATAGLEASALRVEAAELESDLEELTEARDAARDDWRGKELGLELLRERSASSAAEDVQAELSRVREEAHRYVRARLAAVFLRREIERYRACNQGPVLERANALFPRLTNGEWSGVRVGFGAGDEPVLVAVRSDGSEVGVEGLSDGTLDPLYLALRLATLRLRAERGPCPPLVLDDALVHLDDRRAFAALEVLGELSESVQILLFTHHARIVELSRDAVASERLAVHDLGKARERAGS